jgi:hypothetical protein
MVLAQDSRVYRRSSLEVAADAAERVARELRRVAVWHARREVQFVAPRVDAYQHRAHAPPEDTPGRLQSDAMRMQRLL